MTDQMRTIDLACLSAVACVNPVNDCKDSNFMRQFEEK